MIIPYIQVRRINRYVRLPGQFDAPESPDWSQYITVFGLVQEIVVGGCSHKAVVFIN